MIRFIKQEIEIEEALKQRIMIICDFCNTTPTIENGSIRRIDKTNLTYVEPHRITIKNKLYFAFNYSNEIYISNLSKKIKSSKLRVVTYVLNTGEIEQLITNLEYDEFSYDDIVELYKKRWGIETLYYSLKSKLETEKFTSSFKILIEQDFFLVY